MYFQLTRVVKTAVACGVLLIAPGCASSGAEFDALRETANALGERLSAVENQISRINSMAEDAHSMAADAKMAAAEAQSCCDANRERMDRMFERAQQK